MSWKKLLNPHRIRTTTRLREEKRSEIERDYGRVVFSTPVRRLQDKAQVFPLEPIDAVRTRLTHSMEVSSVARGVAKTISTALIAKKDLFGLDLEMSQTIPDLAATCGLVHDIGNPPFGHAGEQAIRDWFCDKIFNDKSLTPNLWNEADMLAYKKDFEHFEGNAQTMRLLMNLQILSDRSGLNLTAATLSAIMKYTASSLQIGTGGQSKKKVGYFQAEKEAIDTVREMTGTGESRNPISFIVEACDDMCYSLVDIEDAIRKCVISWEEVKSVLKSEIENIGESLYEQTVEAAEKRIDSSELKIGGRNRDEAVSQYFRTLVMAKAHEAVSQTFLDNYEEIMTANFDKELLNVSKVGPLYKILKDRIGKEKVWNSKETLRLEILGRNVIQSLLDVFCEADNIPTAKPFALKTYRLLSSNYRTIFENPTPYESTLPKEYRRALLLTDYISGMTDTFALNLHCEIHNG